MSLKAQDHTVDALTLRALLDDLKYIIKTPVKEPVQSPVCMLARVYKSLSDICVNVCDI